MPRRCLPSPDAQLQGHSRRQSLPCPGTAAIPEAGAAGQVLRCPASHPGGCILVRDTAIESLARYPCTWTRNPGGAPRSQGSDVGLPRSVVFELCTRSSRNACSCHPIPHTRSLGNRRKGDPSSDPPGSSSELGSPESFCSARSPPQGVTIGKGEQGEDFVPSKGGGIRGLTP